MALCIHLFGQPRLMFQAQPVKVIAPPKTLPLLAYLLLHRHQPVERQQVAFALWPDDPEAAARANLRRHLHQLQHALPPAPLGQPWLLSDATTLGWNLQADFWLDVAEFERLSTQPAALEEAAACYSGDLLETVYDDWVFFERERLRSLYFDILTRLVLQHRAQRNYARAIAFARQCLARDPFREDMVRQLIALRYEVGDRAGAIQEYHTFERLLREEIGVAPMPETEALHQIVVNSARLPSESDGQSLVTSSTAPLRSTSPALLPFVGREAEMQQALACWRRAARGRGGLLLVGGEAGVGKTRLSREISLLVESQSGRTLHGSGEPNRPRPYQPLVDALESALPLIATSGMDSLRLAALAALIPELGRRRRLPFLPPLEPERERTRLFDAVASCLEKLAEARPLLLVLEDLHWAEETTTSLLEFLTRRAAQHPILILGTYRQEETPRTHSLRALRRRLQLDNLVEHLALGCLSAPAVQSLLDRLTTAHLSPATSTSQLEARLYAESEGHPLFIELLVQQWREAGQVEPGELPGGVRDVILQRLQRLPGPARAYAEVAAITGLAFDAEVVREVGGWDELQALDALGILLDHRLVRDVESRSRFDYVLAHHLIQSTLYAEVPAAKRRRRHRRTAEVLEDLYPDQRSKRAGELAYHYDMGGDAPQAARCYLQAARNSLQVFADQEALDLIARALALEPELRLRFDLLALREEVEHRLGDREAQQADLDRLEDAARQVGKEDLEFECLRRRIRFWHVVGQRQAEGETVSVLKNRATVAGEPCWQAEALRAEAALQVALSQYAGVQTGLRQAIELYRLAGEEGLAGQVSCHCLLAEAAVHQGRFEDAQADLEQAHLLAEAAKDYSLLVQALRAASGALFARQDFAASQRLTCQMLELCRSIGDHEGEADSLTRLGMISTRLWAVREAQQQYEQARTLYAELGKRQGQAGVLVNAGVLALRLGQYAEGQQAFAQAGDLFAAMGDVRGQAVCALNLCMAAYFQGEFAHARAAAGHGLDLARQIESLMMEANALANLGAAERELGELETAIAHMEAGLQLRRSLGQVTELATDLCDLTIAYLRAGALEAARCATSEMLEIYERNRPAMTYPQYILWAAAQVYRAAGEQLLAREYLARACAALYEQAEVIPNDDSRASFFDLPFNRQIAAACERNEWPADK
jgi:DNA-binding SARP family transcriptional activator/predicted ATPase